MSQEVSSQCSSPLQNNEHRAHTTEQVKFSITAQIQPSFLFLPENVVGGDIFIPALARCCASVPLRCVCYTVIRKAYTKEMRTSI